MNPSISEINGLIDFVDIFTEHSLCASKLHTCIASPDLVSDLQTYFILQSSYFITT